MIVALIKSVHRLVLFRETRFVIYKKRNTMPLMQNDVVKVVVFEHVLKNSTDATTGICRWCTNNFDALQFLSMQDSS